MIDCPNVRMRESLPEYLHGLLDRRQRLGVQAHLASCEACSMELAVLERCRASMSVVPAVDTRRIVAALPAPRGSRRDDLRHPADPHATTHGATHPATHAGTHGGVHVAPPLATHVLPLRPDGRRTGHRAGWRVAAVALLMVGALGVVIGRGGLWPATGGEFRGPWRVAGGSSSSAEGDRSRFGDSAMLATAGTPFGTSATGAGAEGAGTGTALSLAGGLSDLSDAALTALLGEVDAVEALPLLEPPPMGAFVLTDESGAL